MTASAYCYSLFKTCLVPYLNKKLITYRITCPHRDLSRESCLFPWPLFLRNLFQNHCQIYTTTGKVLVFSSITW